MTAPSRRTRALPTGVLLATAMASLLSLTACGGDEEEKNYTIPQELCGASIDPQLLEPLLPGGDSFTAEPWSQLPSCRITIDSERQGAMAVYSSKDRWNLVDRTERSRDPDDVLDWDVEDGAVVWLGKDLSGANIAFRCPREGEGENALFDFDIGGGGQISDEEERVERIKEFALNYLEGVKQELCDA